MTTKLRWGILGVAKINERLLPSFAKAVNAELRAIASRSLDKAKAAALAAGIPVAHGSYEALLDDPTVDAVYNPAAQHAACRVDAQGGRARQTRTLRKAALTPTAAEAAGAGRRFARPRASN